MLDSNRIFWHPGNRSPFGNPFPCINRRCAWHINLCLSQIFSFVSYCRKDNLSRQVLLKPWDENRPPKQILEQPTLTPQPTEEENHLCRTRATERFVYYRISSSLCSWASLRENPKSWVTDDPRNPSLAIMSMTSHCSPLPDHQDCTFIPGPMCLYWLSAMLRQPNKWTHGL